MSPLWALRRHFSNRQIAKACIRVLAPVSGTHDRSGASSNLPGGGGDGFGRGGGPGGGPGGFGMLAIDISSFENGQSRCQKGSVCPDVVEFG